MKKQPTVKSIMTPFPHTVEVDATISEAESILKENNFHHLPVVENGKLTGVLSSRDITLSLSLQSNFSMETPTLVRAVYSPIAQTADVDEGLASVLGKLIENKIGSVIITKKDKVAGIITHTDIEKTLLSLITTEDIEPEIA